MPIVDDMDDIIEKDVGVEDGFGGGNQDGATSEIHELWNGGTEEGGLGLSTQVMNAAEEADTPGYS